MQLFKNFRYQFLLLILLSIVSISCSNKYVDDIKRGAGYNYRPGYPELRIEVAGMIDPDTGPIVQVAGSIPYNSLVFKKEEDSLQAAIKISYNITNKTAGTSKTFDYPVQMSQAMKGSTHNTDLYLFEKTFDAAPGAYVIKVSVTDIASKKSTVRAAEAFLPNPKTAKSNITNIRILSKYEEQKNGFFPVTTYDVNQAADSIKFQFQVTNNSATKPLTFQAQLIKFKSDTSIALPMSFSNKSASSIEYKGIDYDEYRVIQKTERDLNQPGNVNVEYVFKNLERGNYRFEVAPNLQKKGPLYKARDFSIKSEHYPAVRSVRELARPLVYLMSEKEYQKLMSIKSDDSLKQAVDRYWLSNLKNSALAKSVISLYYQRVEEANKQFSNYKEGWKTDRGMVYILFGPPLDKLKRLRELRWSYKYNETDPEYTYYFRAPKIKNDYYPFDNYILSRSKNYFNVEYRVRQLWLSGSIISRQI